MPDGARPSMPSPSRSRASASTTTMSPPSRWCGVSARWPRPPTSMPARTARPCPWRESPSPSRTTCRWRGSPCAWDRRPPTTLPSVKIIRSSRASARQEAWSSGSRACPSSASSAPPTPCTASRATHGISRALPGGPAGDPQRLSPRGWCRSPTATTAWAACAFPRPAAASSASSRASVSCPPTSARRTGTA